MIKKNIKRLMQLTGYEIKRVNKGVMHQQIHSPKYSYMLDKNLQRDLLNELSHIAEVFFQQLNFKIDLDYQETVREFYSIYSNHPYNEISGGSGFHNSFWLYITMKIMNPKLIVESGVFRGQGSYVMEKASNPYAQHAFDISLKNLEVNTKNVKYHELDWKEFDFGVIDKNCSIVYFDCHVNHAQRVIEAYEKGFKYLIFDDNPSLSTIYAYKYPGFPSINVILEKNLKEKMHNQNTIEYFWQHEKMTYTLDYNQVDKARNLIESVIEYPDISNITRYGGFSFLTYVKLRD